MELYKRYLKQSEFKNIDDFRQNYKVVVPEGFNFAYDVIDELADKNPDGCALLWVSKTGQERVFTYRELKTLIDKAANAFKSIGIKKGDKVMLVLKRHYQFWYSVLALCKLGAVAIPATHLLTSKDFIYRINAAGIKMVLTTGENNVAATVDEALSECPGLKVRACVGGAPREGWVDFDKLVDESPQELERVATSNQDMMLLYFTSGTTGYPKMVWHNFTYPLGHILTGKYWHNCVDGGLHLTISDTGWAKSMWGKAYGQWLAGSAVFAYDFERFDAADMLSKIEKFRITTFCAPPTMYRYLIKEPLENYDLSCLKHCSTAGEALNPEVFSQWLSKTGHKLYEAFGQTETTPVCITAGMFMEPRVGSMGLPSPGYRTIICDDDGNEVGAGVTGEICIKTDEEGGGKPFGLFSGYFEDDELTGSVWHDGLYHTGDTAWKDEQGYVWYVGRLDDVIKSSGYRIGPFEVESALQEHPAVLECAVTGVPDPDRGTLVKATIVLSKGYQASDALKKELQNHVKKVTAPYKYPRVIEFVESLPKTISGKIRRVEIRENDAQKDDVQLNPVLSAIKERRSVRKYAAKQVNADDLSLILDAACWAPSGSNNQSWFFLAIRDAEALEKLNVVTKGALSRLDVKEGDYPAKLNAKRNATNPDYNFFYHAPTLIIAANAEDYPNAMADCSCALQNMFLAAHSLGLGSCWINQLSWAGDDEDLKAHLEILGLPSNMRVCGAAAVGYAEDAAPKAPVRKGGTVKVVG